MFVAMRDQFPEVAGRGVELLRSAGIAVHEGLLERDARRLNEGYLSRVQRGRPFVRLKMAASLDGATAMANGESEWITGAAARRTCSAARSVRAVLTGSGTVVADDPSLNVRGKPFDACRQPLRVVLDTHLRTR